MAGLHANFHFRSVAGMRARPARVMTIAEVWQWPWKRARQAMTVATVALRKKRHLKESFVVTSEKVQVKKAAGTAKERRAKNRGAAP
jgi:hypothetical protein